MKNKFCPYCGRTKINGVCQEEDVESFILHERYRSKDIKSSGGFEVKFEDIPNWGIAVIYFFLGIITQKLGGII